MSDTDVSLPLSQDTFELLSRMIQDFSEPEASLIEQTPYVEIAQRSINNIPTFTAVPGTSNWPGDYNFQVYTPFEKIYENEQWKYGQMINKLFVKRNAACPINFTINKKITSKMYIRAMAVYSPSSCGDKEVVKRCFNHSVYENSFEKKHLVRCEHPSATYQISEEKQLHSVVIPFENPPCGESCTTYIFKFTCFSSCAGGPNRRPMKLIFQLESDSLEILGRGVFNLKVCGNPLRDCMTEEKKVNYKKTDTVEEFNKKSEIPIAISAPHSSKDTTEKKNEENKAKTFTASLNEQTHDVRIANGSINNIPAFTAVPGISNWPGEFNFQVSSSFEKTHENKDWTYRQATNKLFVKRNTACPMNFTINKKITSRMYIRAMAVYSPSSCRNKEFVKRCFIHSVYENSFEKEHLVLCVHPSAMYQISEDKQLHSVVIPFENPPCGESCTTYTFKFTCFSSCTGGPNRRPMKLIFQLESEFHEILGRGVFNLKVCANPLRDCMTEEKKVNYKKTDTVVEFNKKSEIPIAISAPHSSKNSNSSATTSGIEKKKNTENKARTLMINDKQCYKFLQNMMDMHENSKNLKLLSIQYKFPYYVVISSESDSQ